MKLFKRLLIIAFAAVMLFTTTACGKKQVILMEYEGIQLTSGMFSYGLSLNKTQVLYNITGGITDNADLWAYDPGDGKNIGQAVMDNYIDNTKLFLAAHAELKRLGIEDSAANESSIEEMYQGQVSVQGSVAKLNIYLANFGVDAEGMKEYHRMATKFYELLDYYYGENGIEKFTEQQYLDNVKSTHSLVQHILYKFEEPKDESAVESSEESAEDKTAKAKAQLKAEVEAKVKQIEDGEKTYEDFKSENDDSGFEYLVAFKNSGFVAEFEKAANEMKIGDIRVVETEFGFHMMRKIDLTAEKYAEIIGDDYNNSNTANTAYSVRAKLEQDTLFEKIKEQVDKVVVNEEEIAKYNIATAPIIQ